MREFEQDGEHIWLRQSVTFRVGEQTRTLEIAIPVRPGATADDVERLLAEADAGMERLSRHLDARVATQTGAALPTAPSIQPAPEPTPATPAAPAASSRPAAPEAAIPATSARPAAPARPQPAPTASRQQPARGSGPAPSAAPAPAAAIPSTPQPEMTRPEFIAEIGHLGLDVKQAMTRLGVRSLQGLNLREALEALRRQVLQEGGAAEPEPEPAPPPPARAAEPAHFFEEEDDEPEFTFTVNGEEALPEEQEHAPSHDTIEAVEELDLDDVPDFGPAPAPATPRRTNTIRESPARTRAARQASAPAEPAPEAAPVSRAQEIITEMRAAHGGGTPTSYQRASYKNIVVNELGDDAAALVRALWRATPERLGPEQIDALISWGKRDTFADEAAEVLAALRAEQAAQSGQAKNAPARGRGTTGG